MVDKDMTDTSTERLWSGILCAYYIQHEKGGELANFVRGICRAEVLSCSHPEGGSCSWWCFWHILVLAKGHHLSTPVPSPQKVSAVPLSLIPGSFCHSHGSEAWGSLTWQCSCQQCTFTQGFFCSLQGSLVDGGFVTCTYSCQPTDWIPMS